MRTSIRGFVMGAVGMALVLLGTIPALAKEEKVARTTARREEAVSPKGYLLKTLKWGEETYRYVVYVPADYDGSKAWPLILFLHGAGECGRDGFKSVAVGLAPALMLDADKWPFLVIIPQKPERSHTWVQHDAALMAMLEATQKEYKVDAERLYLTGLSQGGFGTFAVATKHPDLFAAVAPICGWGNPAEAEKLKGLPLWAFHGDADTAVPCQRSQEMVDAIQKAGGNAKLTLYPGVGHNSWDKAYRDEKLYDWFLQHKRPKK